MDTDEDDVIVSETTFKEVIEASSTVFLDSPDCSGITEQDKIQVYRVHEKVFLDLICVLARPKLLYLLPGCASVDT